MKSAAKDAQQSVDQAVRQVMPQDTGPNLDQLWQNMTGRHVLALRDRIGEDMTAQFIRYMMKRQGRL